MPYVLFFACSVIWSASFILMKKAALGFTPWGIGGWRCVWGALILGVLCWRMGGWLGLRRLGLRRGEGSFLALVIVTGCAWPYAIQPLVVSRQGSAFMALIVSLVPLATIIVSVPVLRVWPTRKQLIGVAGALACLALLLADRLQYRFALLDMIFAVSVPVSYAVANTIIRAKLHNVASPILTFYMLLGGGILLMPWTWMYPAPATTSDEWWIAAGALAVLGILGTGLATYWFNKMVREHGPLFAGMTTNVVPIGAVVWGWADREYIPWTQWLALGGIVAMVGLVQFRAARPSAAVERQP